MKKILIADDEPQMTRVLKLYLERAGYQVESASNGAIALTCIQKNAPDVLVTDIQMPLMTGKQLCLALEEAFPQRTFPIFVMTSMTDRDHREWTQKIPNLEFLEKPVSMRALIARLDKHFAQAPTAGGDSHA
jgi:DNA-binding response OmpR family regulator